jgi:hypothetical protein
MPGEEVPPGEDPGGMMAFLSAASMRAGNSKLRHSIRIVVTSKELEGANAARA